MVPTVRITALLSGPCPVCAATIAGERTLPVGEALCRHCGHRLWFACFPPLIRFYRDEDVPPAKRPKIATALIRLRSADSLDIVELVLEMEEQLSVEALDGKAGDLPTVLDLIDYLVRHIRD
jgi:acyl carrier protein